MCWWLRAWNLASHSSYLEALHPFSNIDMSHWICSLLGLPEKLFHLINASHSIQSTLDTSVK